MQRAGIIHTPQSRIEMGPLRVDVLLLCPREFIKPSHWRTIPSTSILRPMYFE